MAKIVNLDENAKNSNVSSVEIFENSEFGKVRTLIINGEPWFVGKDVASALGYKYPANAIQDHVDSDDKILLQLSEIQDMDKTSIPDNIKGSKIMSINESGLYSLIMGSTLESAKKFKRWITSEVLPSIRKTGKYEVSKKPSPSMTKEEYELRMKEVSIRKVEALERLRLRVAIPEFQSIADHYIMEELTGNGDALPLPEADKKTYSATEIGKMFGVSSNKIGRIAKEHNLKTPEYGKLFYDKSKYSNKEVETFRYYENAISAFRKLLSDNLSSKKNTLFG